MSSLVDVVFTSRLALAILFFCLVLILSCQHHTIFSSNGNLKRLGAPNNIFYRHRSEVTVKMFSDYFKAKIDFYMADFLNVLFCFFYVYMHMDKDFAP
jgi:hypothetical protein